MVRTNSTRNRKKNKSELDIISNLHDSVLSHILSFLPYTKEAVKTSILSKRWKYVWTYVDKLCFRRKKAPSSTIVSENMLFGKFVSNVLKLHQGNIKELIMYCYEGEANEHDFPSWIDTVIAQGVEKLYVATGFRFVFSVSTFRSKTLTDLKLNSLFGIRKNIPSALIFPCLKKLDVVFYGCSLESFKRVVSQCSALEYLIVRSHKDIDVAIVSSSMKRLELHFASHFLSRVPFDHKVLLGVPSLEYLHIYCILPVEIIVEEQLSSLIEAHIYFRDSPQTLDVNVKQLRDSFVRFIEPLSNVKFLWLQCHFHKFLNSVGHGLFLNLIKLEIVSNFFEWRLLVSLMESAINLETITLKKISILKKHKLAWKGPKTIPTCLSSSLRKISIDGYYGYRCRVDELPMVKYVLRTAQILERMDIYCTNSMIERIEKLPRACERCAISLLEKV